GRVRLSRASTQFVRRVEPTGRREAPPRRQAWRHHPWAMVPAAGASLERNSAGEALIDEPIQPVALAPGRRLAAGQGEVKTSIVACLRCWYAASTLNAPQVLCLCR